MEEMAIATIRRLGQTPVTGKISLNFHRGVIQNVECDGVTLVAKGEHIMEILPGSGNKLISKQVNDDTD